MLYNAKVVINDEIMDSYVPYVGIQADLSRQSNTNQQTTERCPGLESSA